MVVLLDVHPQNRSRRLRRVEHEYKTHNSILWKNTMDRLDELGIFVRIVEEGSLVRAASRLRRSPPAVTRALAALEDRVGVRLVDRTTRRLAPTEAARAPPSKVPTVVTDHAPAPSHPPPPPLLRP